MAVTSACNLPSSSYSDLTSAPLPSRIDELHTLVGAGSVGRGGGGGLDIANLVKPALARGEFQVGGRAQRDGQAARDGGDDG